MRKLYLLIPLVLLFYLSCEDKKEEDTTPPTVTITFPQNNTTVFELVNITCISSDNEGVEKVELWLNGVSTGMTDETEPYSFIWNTTEVDNGNYTITIRSYDTSENTTDSQPIILSVDNTQSNPQPVNITSLVFENGSFNIIWNPSTDGDFSSYDLEKSVESSMNDYNVVYSTNEVGNTNYVDTDVDPLIYQYYRVTVIDTFDYQTKGEIYSSFLDPVPTSINVESIEYDTEQMTISWSESQDGDFKHYNLLHSESESGDKTSVTTITNKSTTSYSITDFNPNNENWYWVEVSDTLGQTSIGTGMTNSLNNQPTPVDVVSVIYDLESMTLTWEDYVPNLSRINQMNQNTRNTLTNDFVSYELLQSDSENGTYSSVVVITDQTTTSHSLTEFDPLVENWFKVKVTDFWNLTSTGTGMTNDIDSSPTPSVLYPITYNDGFQISWSQNNDDDFVSYKLYESPSENMSNQTLVYETNDRTNTSFDLTLEVLKYYMIVVEDVWGLQSTSNIEIGDYYFELWGEDYSFLNTTDFDISNNQLTGSIPPEIWNLTNLTELYLGSNQLTGSIPSEIGNLTNLTNLDLGDNQFTGSIPSEIGNLTNLTWLGLSGNDLTGSIPSEIGNLTNLIQLYLHYTQLTGFIPSEIGNLTNLTRLYLSNNQLTGSIPPEIGNLTNLGDLFLDNNQLSGVVPDEICNQGDSSPSLSGNQLCPPYPSCIEEYVGEQDLSNCEGFVELWGEYYSIEYTTELNLYNNELTGSIPPEIGNLTNLTLLLLYNNQLTGSIPSEIGNLTNLTKLVLFNNQLTDSIPSEIGNLTNLTELVLFNNQLTGSIPSGIENLTLLTNLILNDNQLTGEIPPEIGNLTNLTFLRLESNQLTGEIPESICDLNIDWGGNYLGYPYFLITNNQLCPPYPSCIEDYVGNQDTSGCN